MPHTGMIDHLHNDIQWCYVSTVQQQLQESIRTRISTLNAIEHHCANGL